MSEELVTHADFGLRHLLLEVFKVGEGLGIIASDVTALKESEAALRHSLELQRTLISALPDAVVTTDLEGRMTFASPRAAELLGFVNPSELLGRSTLEFIVPAERGRAMTGLEQLRNQGVDRSLRLFMLRRDGARFPGELSTALIRGPGGDPEALVTIIRDVTAQHRYETLIQAQRDLALELGKVRSLAEALDVCLQAAVQVSGLDGGGIYLLDETTGALELACSTGLPAAFVRSVSHLEADSPNAKLVGAGKPIYLREAMPTPASANEGIRALAVLPIRHEDRVVGCLNVGSYQLDEVPTGNRNAMEALAAQMGTAIARIRAEERLRQSEVQLRQSQKLEAIGTLAGGIAHDFNNLLTGIIGHVGLVKLQIDPKTELYQDVQVIETAALRAAELTKQLLGFARKGKLRHQTVDVHHVVRDVISILRHTIDKRIDVVLDTRASSAQVMGDPGQLQQVVMNLAVNAADAMPAGGTLTVSTETTHLETAADRTPPGLASCSHLLLRVSDTGRGIAPEIRGRIFEPFFTTKAPGKGTGMGLAMVYGIVTNHGGTLSLETELGGGTVFSVRLPLADEAAPGSDLPSRRSLPTPGRRRILVVDDEEVVSRAVARMLGGLGYEVRIAINGQAGLEEYLAHQDEIDLVILDLAMPVMDGQECYRRLRTVNSNVRVLISTGHAVDGAPQAMLSEGVRGLVQKPYRLDDLARAVAAALGD